MKLVGKVFRYAFLTLIAGVFLLFFVRCAMMEVPARAKTLFPSDAMKEAYAAGTLTVYTQEMADGRITSDGRFSTIATRYVPATGELLVTIRYNNSTLVALGEEYGLGEIYPTNEYFEYSLLDSEGNRFFPDEIDAFRQTIYCYRRLRFSGVSTEKMSEIVLCMYNREAPDYTKEAFGTCFAYYSGWKTSPYTLTRADVRALEE